MSGLRFCSTDLVYLSCPFGGDAENLDKAIEHLAWAHMNTPWGLYVQAPWVASAAAALKNGTTESEWLDVGGRLVEELVVSGYCAVLHMGVSSIRTCTPGMAREAAHMVACGGLVYQVINDRITETTEHWR